MFLTQPAGRLQLSATDLASFLGCRHRTALEMGHAFGTREKPKYDDPQLETLFARGLDHEAAYVERLRAEGRRIQTIERGATRDETLTRTIDAMRGGADVVVQGALGNDRWFGYADVLLKVPAPGAFGDWSYEVADTKLSRETKAGTVLQLALYSVLLAAVQGVEPAQFYVVTPDAIEAYRLGDYAAYFRLIRARLDAAAEEDDRALAAANYPEPVDHCDICPWTGQCSAQRRRDDHLALVAGISRGQRRELVAHEIATTAALAAMPIQPMPFTPTRGAAETFERVREQARVQVLARSTGRPVVESLPIVEPAGNEPAQGLCRLPEPTPGDIFLDLEGDPFAGPTSGPPVLRGREYLFGVVTADGGYQAFWAETAESEKAAFEAVVDLIARARAAHPAMHVFHYAPYEPSAFKRLMGRHATREMEIDALLRSGAFVDLYAVVRQGLRAGIERYSIKNLEAFYGFARDVDLRTARLNLQVVERAVELDLIAELDPEVRLAVEGYNRDDCVSTLRLRDWLETERAALIRSGQDIPRPLLKAGEASAPLTDQGRLPVVRGLALSRDDLVRRAVIMALMCQGALQFESIELAYLLDFHRREEKAEWWEYFRLLELSDEELLDEPKAVSGLDFVAEVGREKKSAIHRYAYPPQEMELRPKDGLKLNDQSAWADIVAVDRVSRTIDVKVGPSKVALRPVAAFAHSHFSAAVIENAIFEIGRAEVEGTTDLLARNLLHRVPPMSHDVTVLEHEVLAVQGPPGAGKTYTGGTMICDLIAAGKTVGIAATSHKVIRNLLDAVAHEADRRQLEVRLAHRNGDDAADDGDTGTVRQVDKNPDALALLQSGGAHVLGGTAWLWSRPEFAKSVDVLFIDEAGQVSLANALAMTRAATSLVLLGDPQQLDQPKKGSHPDGVDVSVLEHILHGHQTMPAEQGMFLAETWRFGDAICDFTSEVFYEGKLRPTAAKHLERQALAGGPIDGVGLFVVEVPHDGNRNSSDEEVAAVARLVDRLLAPGSRWIDCDGASHQMTAGDILVVSPFNVQVSRLQARVTPRCGTVDKFQGQQAPVVIYSMATSRPEDAPRGMEFLYSLNRLNVATSRARCAAIVVANPRLFEPECRTPRQIQLANGLCRFRELAATLTP